jgi:hypothetical protein
MTTPVTATALDQAVRAVCADIEGVYIVNPSDKTTWGIWFLPAATPTERTAAQAALESFTTG